MNTTTIRKSIFAILFAVSAITAQAHRTTDANVHGHVVNSATQEHIPHATITVKGTTIGVVADRTGHFRINNLPVGTLTLVASFVGNESKEIEITTELGKTTEANFYLNESVFALDQVVVSANRRATNRREAVSLVNAITPLTFEITNSSLLGEGLNFIPGLRMENNCTGCGFPQLRINGLEGAYTQLLIDGRPINSALASVYALDHIPANMIERVEVVRGGLSALYGASAIGGTVNIITRENLRNSVSVGNVTNFINGNTPDVMTNLNASIVSDNSRAGVTLFASSRQRSPLDYDGDGFAELGKINLKNIGFRGFYRTGYNSRLTINYHVIEEARRGGQMTDSIGRNMFTRPPYESYIAERTDHLIHSGAFTYDIFFNEGTHALQVYSSVQHVDRQSYFGVGQDMNAFGFTQDFSLVSGGQYTLRMENLWFMPATFIGGVEVSHNHLRDQMPGFNRYLDQTVNIYSVFAQNEWSNRQASILVSARMDKHSMIERPIVVPRIGGRYTPFPWLILRGSFASGYRGPQAFDEDLHVAAVGGNMVLPQIADDLQPERSHSFMLSSEFTHFFGGRMFSFLAEGFYTTLNNVFVIEDRGRDANGNLLLERTNGDGAVVKGINLEANFVAGRNFQINSGFTIQRAMYREPEEWVDDVDIEPQRRMFRAPNHYGYFTAIYSPVRNLDLSLSGIYTGSMLVQHFGAFREDDLGNIIETIRPNQEVNTPAFFDLGFRAAYTFNLADNIRLQLNAGVRNIFNSFQHDHRLNAGKYKDSGYIYGPQLPRTVFVGMRLSI